MSSMDYYFVECLFCGQQLKLYYSEIARDVADHLSARHPVYWAAFLARTFLPAAE